MVEGQHGCGVHRWGGGLLMYSLGQRYCVHTMVRRLNMMKEGIVQSSRQMFCRRDAVKGATMRVVARTESCKVEGRGLGFGLPEANSASDQLGR